MKDGFCPNVKPVPKEEMIQNRKIGRPRPRMLLIVLKH